MNMTYDHLPKPEGSKAKAAASDVTERVQRLLPEHAEVKATRLTKDCGSYAVFVLCSPKLGEEQNAYLLAGLRQRFGEAFFEKFDFTMRRKFAVYVERSAVEEVPV